MDFTNPFVNADRKRLSDSELAQVIRIDMAAELDAINLYVSHLESTENPAAKTIIAHIIEEEKDHLEEFRQLLLLLDARAVQASEHAVEEFKEHGITPAPATSDSGGNAQEADGSEASPTLTVGSLK